MPPIVSVLLFLAVLVSIPFLLKKYKLRVQDETGNPLSTGPVKIVSSVSVGPQQKVVILEMGPVESRCQLVLGVTPQNINCLHVIASSHPGGGSQGNATGVSLALDSSKTTPED